MNHKGQTLITLLIFVIVAMTVAATSVSIIITNSQKTTSSAASMEAYYAAEGGVENAALALLRNAEYSSESITFSPAVSVETTVTFDGQYRVVATGSAHGFTRTIEAIFDYTDTILTIVSWREIF